jgi:hypothetical protein
MRLVLAVLAALLAVSFGAHAQNAQRLPAGVACGNASPPAGISPVYMDAGGNLCSAATTTPSSAATVGITPNVSAALENSHVFKATPGNLYSVYASNLTGGASGFLQVFNATAAPADGAVTPLVCVPFSGGVAQAAYINLPPAVFSTGIVAVVSSATTCFTKTTGVLTAFLSGMVQ